jgi:hypothetical protein
MAKANRKTRRSSMKRLVTLILLVTLLTTMVPAHVATAETAGPGSVVFVYEDNTTTSIGRFQVYAINGVPLTRLSGRIYMSEIDGGIYALVDGSTWSALVFVNGDTLDVYPQPGYTIGIG